MERMKLNIQLFATITTTIIDLPYDDQTGEKENKSAVGITAYFKASSSSTWFNGKNIYFYCKIVNKDNTETDVSPINWDGTAKARTMECSLSKGGSVSKTFYFYYVPHQTDGTLKVRCYWTIATGTSGLGTITESQTTKTQDMATIPRGSTFNNASWNRDTQRDLNTTLSFPATQSVSPAYHRLQARFYRNDTGTEQLIATRDFGNFSGSISFAFSSSELSTIYGLMPSENTHYIRMYLYTYSDSGRTQLIGEASALWWTGKIPASVKPTASITSYTEANPTMANLNWRDGSNNPIFVQNKSQIRVRTSGSDSTGSSINGYKMTLNGNTYNTNDYTTGILTTSTLSVVAYAKNTRETWSDGVSGSVSLVAYSNPQITTATAVRCDSNGTEDDNGTYLKYTMSGSISPVSNKNSHLFRLGYRIKDTGSYTYVNINTNDYSISGTTGVVNANLDTSKTYDIIFEANDYFTSTSILRQIDTAFVIFDFNQSGKAMAIGKVSEASANEEKLEVGIPTTLKDSLSVDGKITSLGEIIGGLTNSAGQFRAVAGNYGFFVRNDGGSTYFMLTDSGSPYGSWNSLRPFVVNNSTGAVYIGNGATISNNETLNGVLTINHSDKTTTIGDQSYDYCHYNTNCSNHYFNKTLRVAGDIYAGSSYNKLVPYVDASSLSANGYIRFSNGLTINWGTTSISSTSSAGNFDKYVAFSKAFSQAPFYASASRTDGSNHATYTAGIGVQDKNGLTIRMSCQSGYASTWNIKWFAIGIS